MPNTAGANDGARAEAAGASAPTVPRPAQTCNPLPLSRI